MLPTIESCFIANLRACISTPISNLLEKLYHPVPAYWTECAKIHRRYGRRNITSGLLREEVENRVDRVWSNPSKHAFYRILYADGPLQRGKLCKPRSMQNTLTLSNYSTSPSPCFETCTIRYYYHPGILGTRITLSLSLSSSWFYKSSRRAIISFKCK